MLVLLPLLLSLRMRVDFTLYSCETNVSSIECAINFFVDVVQKKRDSSKWTWCCFHDTVVTQINIKYLTWLKVDQNWILKRIKSERITKRKKENKKNERKVVLPTRTTSTQKKSVLLFLFFWFSLARFSVAHRIGRQAAPYTIRTLICITKPHKWNVKLIVFVLQRCHHHILTTTTTTTM